MNMKINHLELLKEEILSSDNEKFFEKLCNYFDYLKRQKWGNLVLEKIKKTYKPNTGKELYDIGAYLIAIEEICGVFKTCWELLKEKLKKAQINYFSSTSCDNLRGKLDAILLKCFLKYEMDKLVKKHEDVRIRNIRAIDEVKFTFPFIDINTQKIYELTISIKNLKEYFFKIHETIVSFKGEFPQSLIPSRNQIKKLLKIKKTLPRNEKYFVNNIIIALIEKIENKDYPLQLFEDEIKEIMKSHIYINNPIAFIKRLKEVVREGTRKLRKKGINFAKLKLIYNQTKWHKNNFNKPLLDKISIYLDFDNE